MVDTKLHMLNPWCFHHPSKNGDVASELACRCGLDERPATSSQTDTFSSLPTNLEGQGVI